MARNVSIGLVQMQVTDDPAVNLTRASELVAQAADAGAQIVALPELFTTPYFCVHERTTTDFSINLPGDLVPRLSELARKCEVHIVAGSIYERASTGKFNTSLVFRKNGELLGHYRKTHIPHDEGFFEQNYFTPGDSGFVIFDTGIAKIGVLICYDQWFPEAARAMALAGAEVIFYPTAIGAVEGLPQAEGDWQTAWEAVQRGHAIANNVAVAAINRVGREGRSTFWGGSFLYDAFGKIVAHGGNNEEVVVGSIDLDLNSVVREGWGFFRNRRPEAYGALTARR